VIGSVANSENQYSMSELLNVIPWHCAVVDIKLKQRGVQNNIALKVLYI